jgi:transcriptional regulator with XRE-family HTH domain
MEDKTLNEILRCIGIKLCELRKRKGYKSITEFAAKYKLPLIQYWKIEKGKSNITLKSLFRVLAIHQLTIEEFFLDSFNFLSFKDLC